MAIEKEINILVIIPAKLDSKRLPGKNLKTINGKTLVEHSIDYVKECKHNIDIYVSSESNEVKDVAEKCEVNFDLRPLYLCGETEVVEVYIDLAKRLKKVGNTYDLVVALQPDNPNRSNSLNDIIQYMIDNKYDDLITINESYKRSGSVRVFKYGYLVEEKVSKRIGCIKDTAIDIHYESDLQKVINLNS